MTGFILVLIYFGLAAAAAAILMMPDRFFVSRSAIIEAPPGKVFSSINDLHRWEEWSPWARLDPNARISFSGSDSGVGAAFEWSGDKRVGAGRMIIVDSRPNEGVEMRLEMEKPFRAACDVTFALTPDGPAPAHRTSVVWTISGPNTLLSKATGLLFGRDKALGGQFEKGLANLNALFAG